MNGLVIWPEHYHYQYNYLWSHTIHRENHPPHSPANSTRLWTMLIFLASCSTSFTHRRRISPLPRFPVYVVAHPGQSWLLNPKIENENTLQHTASRTSSSNTWVKKVLLQASAESIYMLLTASWADKGEIDSVVILSSILTTLPLPFTINRLLSLTIPSTYGWMKPRLHTIPRNWQPLSCTHFIFLQISAAYPHLFNTIHSVTFSENKVTCWRTLWTLGAADAACIRLNARQKDVKLLWFRRGLESFHRP